MLAVQLLALMKRGGLSLRELDRQLPPFAEAERMVPIRTPPARALGQFAGERAGEGVVVRGDRGVVLLRPAQKRRRHPRLCGGRELGDRGGALYRFYQAAGGLA